MDRFSGASSGAPLSPSLSLRFNAGGGGTMMGSNGGLGNRSAFPLFVAITAIAAIAAADVVVIIVCGNMFTFGGALRNVGGSRTILGGLTDGGEVGVVTADLGASASGAGSERFLL